MSVDSVVVDVSRGALEGSAALRDWPQLGAISVSGLSMRYREGLAPVLRKVSFEVAPGMKVGRRAWAGLAAHA